MDIPATKPCLICNTTMYRDTDWGIKNWLAKRYCSVKCRSLARVGIPCFQPLKRSLEERFWDKVIKTESGCWGWNGATHPAGYGLLGKGRRAEGLIRSTHVSWLIHKGYAVPVGLIIRHTCDNPPCCNPEHLRIGTHKQNHEDMVKRGREKFRLKPRYDFDNNKCKVSREERAEIVEKYNKGVPKRRYGRVAFAKHLAKEYGLCKSYVIQLVRQANYGKKEQDQKCPQ